MHLGCSAVIAPTAVGDALQQRLQGFKAWPGKTSEKCGAVHFKLNQTPKVTGLFWDLINQEIRNPKVSENDRRRFELSILNLIISPRLGGWMYLGHVGSHRTPA